MERTMKRYGVNHHLSTSYHPQTSGQVENTDRALKRILEKTVKDNPAIWSRKLDDALWAFRTAYKTPTGNLARRYGKFRRQAISLGSLEDSKDPSSRIYTLWKQIQEKKEDFYLKGTLNSGPGYPKGSGFDLKAYSDSNYAGCNLDRKSTSRGCQILGEKLVCWSAKKQSSVAMSSAEAEYVVAGCCAQVLWIKSQLADYDVLYDKMPIVCDNTSAISNNPVLHSRTKHINIRYHFIRDYILKGDIELHFVPTDLQLPDIFTKPLAKPSFTRLVACYATLGLANDKNPELTFVDLAHSSPLRITYFSPTWKVLMVYIVKCLGGNHGSHDQLNINQQMITYALCWGLDIDIAGILFSDLILKITTSGKKGKEKNICYVRYLSLVFKHLLGEAYVNENLKPMKPYQITDATFKPSSISEVPLTSYMCKVAKYSEQTLIIPSKEVNVEGTNDKSSSGTAVHPVSQPKAKTNKRLKKRKSHLHLNPMLQKLSGFKLQRHKPLSLSQLKKQRLLLTLPRVQETIITKAEPVVEKNDDECVDFEIQSVGHVKFEEVKDAGFEAKGGATFEEIIDLYDQKNKADQEVLESPFDIDSEIKVIKRFQPNQTIDEDQFISLGSQPIDMETYAYNETDSGLQFMLKDKLASLFGFETPTSEEATVDNINDT
ncbi:retrovirus-related pol polyprotein from transposon TNT 1-94 [Tanacetum coccineum]